MPEGEVWPRIMIHTGLYHTGLVDDETFVAFWAIAQQGHPLVPQLADRTDKAHNKAAIATLRYNAQRRMDHQDNLTTTHLLYLDADHVHPPSIVAELTRAVREDPTRMVVAALNFRRSEPWDPCAYQIEDGDKTYRWLDWGPGVHPVSVTGMAAMLVNVEVFDKLAFPWFGYDYSHASNMGWLETHNVDDLENTRWPGVDVWFCKRCQDAGIPIYVDTRVAVSPHLGKLWVDDKMWRRYQTTSRFKWHHHAYGARLERLQEVAPELFEKPGTVLYVGATRTRAHYVAEFGEAGNIVDLVEVVPEHVAYWRQQKEFRHVYQGDVRQLRALEPQLPAGRYNYVVWWHGPEHIPAEDLPATLAVLEQHVKPGGLVILGCPWGEGPDGSTLGGYNAHVAAYYPEDMCKLGYHAVVDGVQDSDGSSLIAWKRVMEV